MSQSPSRSALPDALPKRLALQSARAFLVWAPLLLLAVASLFLSIAPEALVLDVPRWALQPAFERQDLYLLVNLLAVAGPFLLSFDKKVRFWRHWRHLFPATALVAAFFIAWDMAFTYWGVWGFNPDYYLPALKIGPLPLEEWLFFFTVPYACLFIYACLNAYIRRDVLAAYDGPISVGLLLLFGILGLWHFDKMYTAFTCLLAAAFLAWHVLTQPNRYRTRFYLAYAVSLLPFLVVDGILTGAATQAPIVIYNPEEFMGLRIVSIPVEDAIYGFLMLFGVTFFMEKWRQRPSA